MVAINEIADANTVVHLTRYDSTHGRFRGEVGDSPGHLLVDGEPIRLLRHPEISGLPWNELDVDVVLECTGAFSERQLAEQHLQRGCSPGVVFTTCPLRCRCHHRLRGEPPDLAGRPPNCFQCFLHHQRDCPGDPGRCHDAFGIDSGTITTIHSAMNDQPVLDAYHHTDLRKTRAVSQSIIPVDTALAVGIERILPDLAGRFSAQALRVPVLNVSAMDLTVQVQADTSTGTVNAALAEAAASRFSGVMGYTTEPLASCDFNHDPPLLHRRCQPDRVSGSRLVKVLIWFDNEWGYANRMLDVARYWCQVS